LPCTIYGNTYSTAGTYITTVLNGAGSCDTIITINLTVKDTTFSTTRDSLCKSFTPFVWNGITVSAAGIYTKNGLTNSAGCDSTATLIVTLKLPTMSSTTLSVCATALPYTWNGLTFTAVGTQTAFLVNKVGCDSFATLILSVNNNCICTCTNVTTFGTPTVSWNIPKMGGGFVPYSLTGNCNTSLAAKLNCGTSYSFGINSVRTSNNCPYTLVTEIGEFGKTPLTTQTNTSSTAPLVYNFNKGGIFCVTYKLYIGGILCNTCTLCFSVCCNIINPTSTGDIKGTKVGCVLGSNTTLSHDSTGGVWSSTDSSIATVDTRGNVKALANGITSIVYGYASKPCGWKWIATDFTVAQVETVAPIIGVSNLCVGVSATLTNATINGVWSSVAGRASINGSAIVSGTSAGIAKINYTVTNSAGCSNAASKSITVNAMPTVPTIAYGVGNTVNPQTAGGFCTNRSFNIIGFPSGGVWSKTGVINITNVGAVTTGNTSGPGSISYSFTNTNGCSNSRTVSTNIITCASRGANNLSTIDNSVWSMDNGQWTLFPNPARTFISLNVETLIGRGSIVVTDLNGKTVKTQALSMGTNTVDIAKLSKGMYFVSVITGEGKSTKKLIIE
jgi:hypothetical protein